MEKKLRNLKFIRGVVSYLVSASFQTKGWSVLMVSSLLVVPVQGDSLEVGLVSLLPILVFFFFGSTDTFCPRSGFFENCMTASAYATRRTSFSPWMSRGSGIPDVSGRAIGSRRSGLEHCCPST